MESRRRNLKADLARLYAVPTSQGMRMLCGVCQEVIREAPDMHEAVITRGEWRPLPAAQIMVIENCVPVHPGGKGGRCHSLAHTVEGRRISVETVLEAVSEEAIITWLESLREATRSGLVEEKIRLVREVADLRRRKSEGPEQEGGA